MYNRQQKKKDKVKMPPHNISAEKTLLTTILHGTEQRKLSDDIFISLKENDFFDERNRIVFSFLKDMYEKEIEFIPEVLIEKLTLSGTLDEIGIEYITELMRGYPTNNIRLCINILKEKSILRRFIDTTMIILDKAYTGDDIKSIIDETEIAINSMSDIVIPKQLNPISTELESFLIDMIHKKEKHQDDRLHTDFVNIDNIICGVEKGALVIIGARPSMGKTALMLNIAKKQAYKDKKVALFSLEMTKEQILQRMICDICQVDTKSMYQFDDKISHKLSEKVDEIKNLPIFINDNSYISVYEIKSECRRVKAKHGLDAIYIDYLQLLLNSVDKAYNLNNQISAISRSLKQLAKELKVPIFLLCQLNRGIEGRNEKTPQLSDLRDSGAIEQDADIVMFLHRKNYYTKEKYNDGLEDDDTQIYIAKNRNGACGIANLRFKKQTMTFSDKFV